MEEKITSYKDEKSDKIKEFNLLSNLIWRRINYLCNNNFKQNEKIKVIEPCCGGGKLISAMNKKWKGVAYEPNYAPYMYANYYLEQNDYDVEVTNEPFEYHFTLPFFEEYHFAVSIPYTNREINTMYESNKDLLKVKNYSYYVMIKSIDVLQKGGFGVFAIPKDMMDTEYYQNEIKMIADKTTIISSEGFENFVILIFKKK